MRQQKVTYKWKFRSPSPRTHSELACVILFLHLSCLWDCNWLGHRAGAEYQSDLSGSVILLSLFSSSVISSCFCCLLQCSWLWQIMAMWTPEEEHGMYGPRERGDGVQVQGSGRNLKGSENQPCSGPSSPVCDVEPPAGERCNYNTAPCL